MDKIKLQIYGGAALAFIALFSLLNYAMWVGANNSCRYNGYDGATQDYGIIHCQGDGYPKS